MIKNFVASLKDGFANLRNIPRERLENYRAEGIRVDDEGIHCFSFGEHKEYEQCLEPFGEEGEYLVALYKNGILLTEKLHMKAITREDK